jgi:hypothetical protein
LLNLKIIASATYIRKNNNVKLATHMSAHMAVLDHLRKKHHKFQSQETNWRSKFKTEEIFLSSKAQTRAQHFQVGARKTARDVSLLQKTKIAYLSKWVTNGMCSLN